MTLIDYFSESTQKKSIIFLSFIAEPFFFPEKKKSPFTTIPSNRQAAKVEKKKKRFSFPLCGLI